LRRFSIFLMNVYFSNHFFSTFRTDEVKTMKVFRPVSHETFFLLNFYRLWYSHAHSLNQYWWLNLLWAKIAKFSLVVLVFGSVGLEATSPSDVLINMKHITNIGTYSYTSMSVSLIYTLSIATDLLRDIKWHVLVPGAWSLVVKNGIALKARTCRLSPVHRCILQWGVLFDLWAIAFIASQTHLAFLAETGVSEY